MTILHPDLFPETLLVTQRDGMAIVTSLRVAEHSGKRHTDVLRAVESKFNDLPEAFRRRNFASATYLDRQKKPRSMYEMTEEGFALTMMGFTGKDALLWQVEFIEAFVAMRAQLRAREARFAAAFDQVRPFVRPVVESTERGLSRSATAAPLGKSPGAITYHRRQARRFGLLS